MPPERSRHATHKPTPTPTHRIRFDPWTSSTSGHQTDSHHRRSSRREWRASRTAKLARQFDEGRVLQDPGGRSERAEKEEGGQAELGQEGLSLTPTLSQPPRCINAAAAAAAAAAAGEEPRLPGGKKIFQGLQIYISGSTAPRVSDHRLKQILVQHGAGVCVALARRTVTHVILGTPNGGAGAGAGAGEGGSGGGLSARKIQTEIKRVQGGGVKYVGVEWCGSPSFLIIPFPSSSLFASSSRLKLNSPGRDSVLGSCRAFK